MNTVIVADQHSMVIEVEHAGVAVVTPEWYGRAVGRGEVTNCYATADMHTRYNGMPIVVAQPGTLLAKVTKVKL